MEEVTTPPPPEADKSWEDDEEDDDSESSTSKQSKAYIPRVPLFSSENGDDEKKKEGGLFDGLLGKDEKTAKEPERALGSLLVDQPKTDEGDIVAADEILSDAETANSIAEEVVLSPTDSMTQANYEVPLEVHDGEMYSRTGPDTPVGSEDEPPQNPDLSAEAEPAAPDTGESVESSVPDTETGDGGEHEPPQPPGPEITPPSPEEPEEPDRIARDPRLSYPPPPGGPTVSPSAPGRGEYTRDEMSAVIAAEREEARRNFWRGALLGWFVERAHRKRATKKLERELRSKDEAISNFQEAQERQATQISSLERQAKRDKRDQEAQLNDLERDQARKAEALRQANTKAAEQARPRPEAYTFPIPGQERQPDTPPEAISNPQQRIETVESSHVVGSPPEQLTTPERPIHAQPEAQKPLRAPESQVPEEPAHVSPERRVETSAWHRIEVDAKTGKVVDNPEVPYGDEFVREQARERMQDDDSGFTSHEAGALGGAALHAASSQPNSSAPSQPSKTNSSKTATPVKQVVKYAKSPVTWLLALLIVIVLFAIGLFR